MSISALRGSLRYYSAISNGLLRTELSQQCRQTRLFSFSRSLLVDNKPTQPSNSKHDEFNPADFSIKERFAPTNWDKKLLVWGGLYKTAEEVPATVDKSKMVKAKDWFRIRVNLGMILATLGGCILMIIYGRKARDAGDSLSKRGRKWESDMRELGIKERAAAAEKAS